MFAQRAAVEIREKKKQEIIHALANDPKDVTRLVELAKLFLVHRDAMKKHAEEACDLIVRANLAGCKDPGVWKLRGDCHMALWHSKLVNSKKHLHHALSCYRRAMKSKEYSTNVVFLFMIAKAYKDYGSLTGSLAILSQIISTFETFKKMHLVIHNAATILFHVGKYKDSLTYLKHVLQRPPEYYGKAYVLLQTARVFVADENPRAAREVLAKARTEFLKKKSVGGVGIGSHVSSSGSSSSSTGSSSSSPNASPISERNKHHRKNMLHSEACDDGGGGGAEEAIVSSWASRPCLWIEAGMLYTKHDDIIFAADALSHALALNSALDAATSDEYVSDFPYFVLSVACYRTGDESRAIQYTREWLKKHKTDQDAKDAMELWTKSKHASSESTVTLRTGLVVKLPPGENERYSSSASPKALPASKRVQSSQCRRKANSGTDASADIVHPIPWLTDIYKPPPSALEIAQKRAAEIAKKKAERERQITKSLQKKKLARQLRMNPKAKAAMRIQSIARGRYHRRRYAHRRRRHRRKYAIVLQRYVRGHNGRVRVLQMREDLRVERERVEQDAEREAIALVDSKMSDETAGHYAYEEVNSMGAYGGGGGYATTVPPTYGYGTSAISSDYSYGEDPSLQQHSYWNAHATGEGGEWVEGYDAHCGRRYMYNESTGETQWV